jgi:hypothetical protein
VVKQVGDRRFLMRSLPFFTYGIAFEDEVETDETLTITRVVQRSATGSCGSRSSGSRAIPCGVPPAP